MTKRLLLSVLLLAAILPGQIGAPKIGFIRDRAGNLREVTGVIGSFLVGPPIESGLVAAGFGRTVGYAKKQDELVVFRQGQEVERHPAPPGGAVFQMEGNEIKAIYFTDAKELWRVTRNGFDRESFAPEPEPQLRIERDEAVLPRSVCARLPEPAVSVEWMGDVWVAAQGASGSYAIRLGDAPEVFHLPESAQ